jgi:hypothetical protein
MAEGKMVKSRLREIRHNVPCFQNSPFLDFAALSVAAAAGAARSGEPTLPTALSRIVAPSLACLLAL